MWLHAPMYLYTVLHHGVAGNALLHLGVVVGMPLP